MTSAKQRRQLFLHAPAGTTVFRVYEKGRVYTYDVSGVPLPTWPDGRWCIELAAYMHSLAVQRLSVLDRGGTLGTYASELSHLVRYCYANRVDFHRLTDAQFQMFVRSLGADKRPDGEQVRNNRTIIKIGRHTLSFLDYVGRRRGIADFLSPDGPHIQAVRKKFFRKIEKDKTASVEYWHHPCFPAASPINRRLPVPETSINLLREAAAKVSASPAQKRRRLTLLRVLEATGARRIEVANLKVADVLAAKAMERPFLKLLTVKQKGDAKIRFIPVSHSELDYIIEYIELYRAPIVERFKGDADDGFVFVSHRTGQCITPNTVTQEIHKLRKAAGIEGKAHPHLFRHRFLTVRMYRLIRAYDVKDARHFLELFLTVEKFKIDVMEQAGLKSGETFARYVDWAFALAPLLDKEPTLSIDLGRIAREGRAVVVELEAERDSLSPAEYTRRVERELKKLVGELSRADGFKSEQTPGNAMLAKTLSVKKD